ncbi:hypothetical protein BT93_F0053 [Corymbia citriodora subsp. variegata]|nr:hypothetical protein BT93_F0053 [Corymbia citriodora subsp. variegata]
MIIGWYQILSTCALTSFRCETRHLSVCFTNKLSRTLASSVLTAIEAGKLKLKLGGVALGNSWISPEDFVFSWAPLLKDVSRLDDNGVKKCDSVTEKIRQQLRSGQYTEATDSWRELEELISSSSNSVDFYNFLLDSGMDPVSTGAGELTPGVLMKRYARHLSNLKASASDAGDLDSLMNGAVKKKLQIIPANFTWGEQSDSVFSSLQGDFMKPRIEEDMDCQQDSD